MKFLIDRCTGRRMADWPRNGKHDVVEARDSALIPVVVRCWTAPLPRGGLS